MHKQIRLFSFFTGYRLFKLVLFLVGFLVVFFFTYVLCQEYLTEKLSGKSYEYGHQVYWQIYLDQFSYLSRSSRSLCIYFTIFYPSYPPWAPDIQPSSPVISVFYRCCWWFHECLFRSLSVLQFCFSVCLCVVVFLFLFLRALSVEVLVYLSQPPSFRSQTCVAGGFVWALK